MADSGKTIEPTPAPPVVPGSTADTPAREASRHKAAERPAAYETFSAFESELVFGLVGPLGVDNHKIRRILEELLRDYRYVPCLIRLSTTVIPALYGSELPADLSPFDKAEWLIEAGNKIRTDSNNNAILAIAAAAHIKGARPESNGVTERNAYIITTLKRREEVEELRKIYSNGFYLIGIHAERSLRIETLVQRDGGMKRWEAEQLISRDEHEADGHGQDTRDTFHLADFFISDDNNDDKLRNDLRRCLDLTFGHPHVTPTFNEFAMFMAFASSVRSADLSRQVGAVVARDEEILSTGANDSPRAGGGLYWPGYQGNKIEDAPRGRDYKRGFDSNVVERLDLIKRIGALFPPEERKKVKETLAKSPIKEITEYGRVVHAEMEALLACARGNSSTIGATIYCTTFPCHNCAKHIIASGIRRVIYVEPYPKSKALKFHDDSARLGVGTDHSDRVAFEAFVGVGPRLFIDLFSLAISAGRPVRRKEDESGNAVTFVRSEAKPRLQMLPFTPDLFEMAAEAYLKTYIGA